MLLRRVMEHVRTQNWLAVALDFLIVVAGVFIGIQVSNWNEARNNQLREGAYLQRLHDEAEGGLQGILKTTDEAWTGYLANMVDVIAMIDEDPARLSQITSDQCKALTNLSGIIGFPYQFPTLEELIASGNLDLITHRELRYLLTDYAYMQKNSGSLVEYFAGTREDIVVMYPEYILADFSVSDHRLIRDYVCRGDLMAQDPRFLTHLQNAAARFEGYYNIVLRPEVDGVRAIHELLDELLGIEHAEDAP